MKGKDKLAVTTLVVALLGGLWLAAAPWIVGYQPRGAEWTTGTLNEFWVGIGLVAVTFAALVTYVATGLRSLTATAAAAAADTEPHVDATQPS